MSTAGALAGLGFGLFAVIIYLVFFALWIWITILAIKFMTRGIKALDIYISKNTTSKLDNVMK